MNDQNDPDSRVKEGGAKKTRTSDLLYFTQLFVLERHQFFDLDASDPDLRDQLCEDAYQRHI